MSDDQKMPLYSPIRNQTITNTIKMNDISNNNGIVYTISSKPTIKQNVWYGNHTDEYCGIERGLYNGVERGYNNHTNNIEKIGYKNYSISDMSPEPNEYRNYTDLLDSKYENDECKEDSKMFQWPQTSLPQLYSNETISLDIDDEKIVGILV